MNGLGSKVKIVGEGTVSCSFRDDYGVIKKVKVKAHQVPANKSAYSVPNATPSKRMGVHFL